MNNTRRKKLANIIVSLESMQELLEILRDEEQEYLDNIPENLRDSERYSISEDAIENMESAIETFSEVVEFIDCAKQ